MTEVTAAGPVPGTRRRWPRRAVVGIVVVIAIAFVAIVWLNRLEFPYDGPHDAVAPGDEVTIRDPGGACGPLVVSIWSPSVLGQWNQTHNGSFSGFGQDPRPWWKVWEGEGYATPVPCFGNGETSFTLPEDLESGTIAVCTSARKCARIEVA